MERHGAARQESSVRRQKAHLDSHKSMLRFFAQTGFPAPPRFLSIILSSCCCTFPFPHAPKSTKNFLLSTRKKAATKHTQNFCHMRRKRGAAAWGMRHRMQAAAGQAATRHSQPHCDEVGHDKFYDLLRNSNTKLNLMCARNILLYVPHSCPCPCPCPCSGLWQYAKYTESVDNSKNTDRKHKQ